MGSTKGLWYLDRAEFGMTLLEAETGGSRQRGWAGRNAQAVPARVSKTKLVKERGESLDGEESGVRQGHETG